MSEHGDTLDSLVLARCVVFDKQAVSIAHIAPNLQVVPSLKVSMVDILAVSAFALERKVHNTVVVVNLARPCMHSDELLPLLRLQLIIKISWLKQA